MLNLQGLKTLWNKEKKNISPKRWEAREVYECCMKKAGYDVHQLDGDLDGRACEW